MPPTFLVFDTQVGSTRTIGSPWFIWFQFSLCKICLFASQNESRVLTLQLLPKGATYAKQRNLSLW
jgi:hypothetical protein